VAAFAYYVPLIGEKNKEIASLDSQVSQLTINATNLQNQVNSLNLNVTDFQNQVNNLTDALNLHKFTVWYNETIRLVPPLELYGTTLEEHAPYAGYVSVHASSLQGNETVVEFVYYSEALDYRHEDSVNLGSNGTAIFPVLPSDMAIYFGDPHLEFPDSRTATVTVIYYY
jgi:hypothetical protein